MEQISFKGKKILVMGLGLNGGGLGTVKWLAGRGAKVTVTDLKTEKELAPTLKKLKGLPIKYILGRHRASDFRNADLLIKNPGVPDDSEFLKIARQSQVPAETDISLFFQLCPAPIIGITGSKGKSTTTSLVGEILRQVDKKTVVAGNIGRSPLDFLPRIRKDTPVVLELSSWQLEGLKNHRLSPHIAAITNIFPDHLDRYHGMVSYVRAKGIILKYQLAGDIAVLNYDDARARDFAKTAPGRVFYFSASTKLNGTEREKTRKGTFVSGGKIIFQDDKISEKICSVKDIKLKGNHNLENALAAVTVAVAYGVSVRTIRKVLKNFKGVPHRLELVREIGGIRYYNDTAATIPEASVMAIHSFPKGKVILIAGGADKNLNFRELAEVVKNHCKSAVLLGGSATPKIEKQLEAAKFKNIEKAYSMAEAVSKARVLAEAGDIVLLSPACASFGMFVNEFDRGDRFRKAAGRIKA